MGPEVVGVVLVGVDDVVVSGVCAAVVFVGK